MVATPVVGSEIAFSTDPQALLPRVTALADDSFILAWDSEVFAPDGTLVSGDLFARHLDPTGNFITGNFLQQTDNFAHQASGDPVTTPLLVQQSDGSIAVDMIDYVSGAADPRFRFALGADGSVAK